MSEMNYQCGSCGGTDCKLWRQSHVFADSVELICWTCLEKQGHSVLVNEKPPARRTDQVYDPDVTSTNYVPAVPNLNGNFWGYTSVPRWWVAWWKELPDKPDECTLCRGTGKLEEFACGFCKGTGMRGGKASYSTTSRMPE